MALSMLKLFRLLKLTFIKDRDQTRQKAKKLLLQQKQLTGENDKLKDKVKAMSSQLHELERIIRKLENEKNQAEGSINNLRSQLKEEQVFEIHILFEKKTLFYSKKHRQ